MNNRTISLLAILLLLCIAPAHTQDTPTANGERFIDKRVRSFMESHRGRWRDMNVPESDGRMLYDIIVKNGYRRALEIGTSTGFSGIWIAWALSRTGGKLITIEIDERRHRRALENFREAGLDEFVDARLGDAHNLVPELEGPFDFVFSDADKEWYTRYFTAVYPKLVPGGCFTAHNVLNTGQPGISEFMACIEAHRELETSVIRSSGSGISVSYREKTAEKR